MLIRCPKCGFVYSYVRNICHICEDHPIFFGALFNGNQREYQWNCNKNSISLESKYSPIESKPKINLEDAGPIMEQRIERKWNCNSYAEKYE